MIRIGPVGWTHPRLAELWPRARGRDFSPLGFIASRFGCVEADTPAVSLPPPGRVKEWVRALADAPRTRLTVRLPLPLTDPAVDAGERDALLTATRAALAPLFGRPRLAALVGVLPSTSLAGPRELRALAATARGLKGSPLVLEASHASWFEHGATEALRGAGWGLSHLASTEGPWRSSPPAPAAPAMLRVVGAGALGDAAIETLAQRARVLETVASEVLIVAAQSGGRDDALDRLRTALDVKRALAPSAMIPPWPELDRTLATSDRHQR